MTSKCDKGFRGLVYLALSGRKRFSYSLIKRWRTVFASGQRIANRRRTPSEFLNSLLIRSRRMTVSRSELVGVVVVVLLLEVEEGLIAGEEGDSDGEGEGEWSRNNSAASSTSMASTIASIIRGLWPRTRRGLLSCMASCLAVEMRRLLDGSEVMSGVAMA